ncbi:MAG: hypothetical protein ABSD56_08615 [Bryobacteraceae bacterium]
MRNRVTPLVLLALVVLAGCSRPGGGRIDPALASLVPANTVVLAGIKLEALRGTPVYKKHLAARMPSMDRELAWTGIEERNIQEILVASDGIRTAVLLRGRFSPDAAQPPASARASSRSTYQGYTLITSADQAVAFMNSSTAVTGTPDSVRAIIDQRGKSNGIPPALEEQLASIPKASQLWAVGTGGLDRLAQTAPGSAGSNVGRALSRSRSIVAAADLQRGVDAVVTLTCVSERDATDIADALQAFVSLARLAVPSDRAEARRAFEGIKVERQQQQVKLTVALSETDLDRLSAGKR